MSKAFLDTNILFYACDSSEPSKQLIAQSLLMRAMADRSACTSVQVLGEFFHSTVIRKRVLSPEEAGEIIARLGAMQIVDVDFPIVRSAIDYHRRFRTSYWDSLILAAAKRGGCDCVLSEDFNAGQSYDGIEARNPFAPGHQMR